VTTDNTINAINQAFLTFARFIDVSPLIKLLKEYITFENAFGDDL